MRLCRRPQRIDSFPIPGDACHSRRGDDSELNASIEVAAKRERVSPIGERRVAHEVRPADEDGRVRAKLPVVLEPTNGVARRGRYRGPPEGRRSDRVGEEHELGVRVPYGDESRASSEDGDGSRPARG